VTRGIRSLTGDAMPVNPKRRFQDGVGGAARGRATKAWCRRVFDRYWQEQCRAAEDLDRRSGNEMVVRA
jgi:hypothetical protein